MATLKDIADLITLNRNIAARHGMRDADVLGTLIQPGDAGADFVSGNNNYLWWYAIGGYFRPRRIAEIGTRFGYSLWALASGVPICQHEFVIRCWDAEVDADKEPLKVAESYFAARGFGDFRAYRLNTRRTDHLAADAAPFDLVSVDGDHSTAGALADMKLLAELLRPGGIVVVDDTNPGSVSEAVDQYVRETGAETAFLPTYRGATLVRPPAEFCYKTSK